MSISTGSSIEEQSGSITIDVGTTTNGPGSNIDIRSGQTLDEEQKGGSTVILGGDGSGGGGSLIMSQCLTSGVTLETGISGSSQESASGSILHSCLEKIPNNGFKTISRAISSEILST